jgi:hypothetical protein
MAIKKAWNKLTQKERDEIVGAIQATGAASGAGALTGFALEFPSLVSGLGLVGPGATIALVTALGSAVGFGYLSRKTFQKFIGNIEKEGGEKIHSAWNKLKKVM